MDIGVMKQILLEEMQKYTGKGLNDYAYLTSNESDQIYTVVDIATIRDKRIVVPSWVPVLLYNRL